MATSHSDNWNELHCQQGSCKIILKPGDLLDEKDVNVLVIPTPAGGMNPDNFQLFKSIYSNADENCKREIKKVCFNLTQSEPQTFSLYGLRYIFVAPPYVGNRDKAPKYLKETYTSCLKLAVKSNFRTIAFPTIGCGVIGFPIDDAARSVYSAIENFCQSKDGKKMDEIRIVIYDKNIYNEFIGIFIETDQTKKIKFNFVTISTKTSNRSEMSSTRDKQHETQQPSNKNASQDYSDDFDDDDKHRRPGSGMARQTSNLNPNSPEFQPKTNNNKRVPRHFCLNNKRTELIIIQGDILKTRVDAIVNGLLVCLFDV
ncbi:unnamed protein product [Rotaria sp. Silwood1]|nr:unnamed protein product [Rotaria sp. Silwood1]